MRTVKELKEELAKFPEDAVCFATECEVVGIVIERAGTVERDAGIAAWDQGFIPCSEGDGDSGKETKLIGPWTPLSS
jgi:hypothetical protein